MLSICLQAIPIPHAKASAVKNIFNLAAKRLGFEFQMIKGKLSWFTWIKVELVAFLMPHFLFCCSSESSPLPFLAFWYCICAWVVCKSRSEELPGRENFISSSGVLLLSYLIWCCFSHSGILIPDCSSSMIHHVGISEMKANKTIFRIRQRTIALVPTW